MSEDRHDGLDLRAAPGELGADRVPEAVRGHGPVPVTIHQAGGPARDLQRLIEQESPAHRLAAGHEHPPDRLLRPGVEAGGRGGGPGQLDQLAERPGGLRVQRDHAFGVGHVRGLVRDRAQGGQAVAPGGAVAEPGSGGWSGGGCEGDLVANGRANRLAWCRPAQVVVRPSLAQLPADIPDWPSGRPGKIADSGAYTQAGKQS
jgi:hypothetical protein